jgi:hypothetical protein
MVDFSFLSERKKLLFTLAGVLIFLSSLIGGRMYFEYSAKKSNPVENENLVVEFLEDLQNPRNQEVAIISVPEKVSPLTGLEISEKVEVKPVAIMIENHPASRAQMRGLAEAGIVYEALAEGGITRFLAIFDTSEKKRIGPVRSARPYFVEWAKEFGGAFVHAGGSIEALETLEASTLLDFDEDGEIVYRDFQYLKPHNLFVNLKDLREENFEGNLQGSWFDFSGEISASAVLAKQFSIDFSLSSYLVDYVYDAETGKYHRLLGGIPHTANGVTIQPTNIIIQFTEYYPIDDEGRLELKTTGEDIAWYFSCGKMWKGVWKKIGNKTQFFDSSGKSVKIHAGQTFIEVLDSTMRVKIPEALEEDLMEN